MGTLGINELRKNVKILIDDQPWQIIDSDFVKPGKGQAFTRCRIRNYLTGNTIERTFKNNEKIQTADVEDIGCQYLYSDGEDFHFMDNTSYDQFRMSAKQMGSTGNWMQENMDCRVLFWNSRPMSVALPNTVTLEITECEPGAKGDTAQGATKPATLVTGAIVNVPLFINQGDTIKIDTDTGKYLERAKL